MKSINTKCLLDIAQRIMWSILVFSAGFYLSKYLNNKNPIISPKPKQVEEQMVSSSPSVKLEGSYNGTDWHLIPTYDIANKIVQDTVINGKKYNYIMSKIGIND